MIALKTKEPYLEAILEHTVVVYPIQFPQRLELLVIFHGLLKLYTSTVCADKLKSFASILFSFTIDFVYMNIYIYT